MNVATTDSTSQEHTFPGQNPWGLSLRATIGWIALTLLLAITGQVVFASIWAAVTGASIEDPSVLDGSVFQLGLWFGALSVPVYLMFRRRLSFGTEMGLRLRWTDIPLGIALGVILQVVVLRIVNLPLELFFPKQFEELSQPATESLGGGLTSGEFALRGAMAAIGAPIVEEIVFRGFFFGALVRKCRPWVALIGSSLLFGAIHQNLVSIVSLSLVGFACAYVYYRSKRLGLAITLHMGFNAVAVVFLFLSR